MGRILLRADINALRESDPIEIPRLVCLTAEGEISDAIAVTIDLLQDPKNPDRNAKMAIIARDFRWMQLRNSPKISAKIRTVKIFVDGILFKDFARRVARKKLKKFPSDEKKMTEKVEFGTKKSKNGENMLITEKFISEMDPAERKSIEESLAGGSAAIYFRNQKPRISSGRKTAGGNLV